MLLCLGTPGRAEDPAHGSPTVEYVYHSRIPLGTERFQVKPWNSVLAVLASAESPHFEGWRRVLSGKRSHLLNSAGQSVRFYPGQVGFRISVGTMTKLDDLPPWPLRASLAENDYLLNLHFRVKVFHGLRETTVEPEAVAMIGMPADIPSQERIYRALFSLERIPMDDRVVLEVVAPSGERLCKFHLDLQ
jgi:hypothetical protein